MQKNEHTKLEQFSMEKMRAFGNEKNKMNEQIK